MNSIYPAFWFDNNSKEAAEFYTSIFPDSKIISVMNPVVDYELMGQNFQNIDGGPMFQKNPSISMFVNLKSEEEVNRIWGSLIEGGMSLMELGSYPWARRYGWLQDKFGLSWQLSYSENYLDTQLIKPSFMFCGEQTGNAIEALEKYTKIFPNSVIKSTTHYQEGDGDKTELLKNAQFSLNGYDFMAMDSSIPHQFAFNEGISIVVMCEDQAEIDYFWEKLIEDGGQESMCGWLKDPYGVSWQIVPKGLESLMSDPEKSKKVMQVLLKMRKLDIEKLKSA